MLASFALLALLALSDSPTRLEIEVALESSATPSLTVRTRLHDRSDSETTITMAPHWASARDLPRAVRAVSATTLAGEALTVEPQSDGYSWKIHHPGETSIEFLAELRSTQPEIGAGPDSYYQLLLQPDLFHAVGQTFLFHPIEFDPEMQVAVELSLRGFREQGWRTACSFGLEDELEFTGRLGALTSSIFIASKDLRIHERQIGDEQVAIAIGPGRWQFQDEQFVELATRILAAEREAVDAPAQPFFLITAIGIGGQPHSSFGGTALTNSFALFLTADWTLNGDDRDKIQLLLAHEIFHQWNGHLVRLAQPEQTAYWFSEGFTEYFCRRILWEAGLMSDDAYIASVNQQLREYALNPFVTAANERIAEEFFTSRELGQLPYHRGHAVALWLDAELRRRSDGTESLADWFRSLCEEAVSGADPIDNETLLGSIEEWTSSEFAQVIAATVLQGEMPSLPADLLPLEGALETVTMHGYDAGFDVKESQRALTVQGTREGSSAWKAGLRDGQAIAGLSIHWNQIDQPVLVQIRGPEGVLRDIEYLPHGETAQAVPQWVSATERPKDSDR